jgi:hypothetical protein
VRLRRRRPLAVDRAKQVGDGALLSRSVAFCAKMTGVPGGSIPPNPRRQLQAGTGKRLARVGQHLRFAWTAHAVRAFADDLAPNVAPGLAWLPANPTADQLDRAWATITSASGVAAQDIEQGLRSGEAMLDDKPSPDGIGRVKRWFRVGPQRRLFVGVIEPIGDAETMTFRILTGWAESRSVRGG